MVSSLCSVYNVSQATVSRDLATENRRPRQSGRTFIRNQAIAFSHHEHRDPQSEGEYRGLLKRSKLTRTVAQRLSAAHSRRALTPPTRGMVLCPGQRGTRRCSMYHEMRCGTRPSRGGPRQSLPKRCSDTKSALSGSRVTKGCTVAPNRDLAFRGSSFEGALGYSEVSSFGRAFKTVGPEQPHTAIALR